LVSALTSSQSAEANCDSEDADQAAGAIDTLQLNPTSRSPPAQVSREGEDTDLVARGRHDPCVVPRAVPMVEAMVALVLADQLLQARSPPTPHEPDHRPT